MFKHELYSQDAYIYTRTVYPNSMAEIEDKIKVVLQKKAEKNTTLMMHVFFSIYNSF